MTLASATPALRDAKPADLDALLHLERACFSPDHAFPPQLYRDALARRDAINLVAESDGALVGFIGAFAHVAQRAGHVYTLNVAPGARRRGIGRLLLRECEARLHQRGARRCELEVAVENEPAIRLYENEGYDRVRRLRGYYAREGAGDAWAYSKVLT